MPAEICRVLRFAMATLRMLLMMYQAMNVRVNKPYNDKANHGGTLALPYLATFSMSVPLKSKLPDSDAWSRTGSAHLC